MLNKALAMGADVGISKIIDQTGDETGEHVYQKLMRGQQQFWSIASGQDFVATVITQIEQREITKVLVVRYMYGKGLNEWLPQLHQALTDFARETGCDAIRSNGRPGLWGKLRDLGWKKIHVGYWTEV